MSGMERLLQIMRANRLDKKHEDWGFPRGWNEAFDFVEREIGKLVQQKSQKAGIEN